MVLIWHRLKISECAAKRGECDESKGRPVCGTDDQTYPSRCHLLRVQCSGHQVSLKYRGPCKACREAREYALKHKSRNPTKFIPRCKTDGTYAPVQCLGDTGCWCSDITGKPIENTTVRTGRPRCREFNKPNIRRSPSRHPTPSRGRRNCNQEDRAAFNTNLIRVFQSEYLRSGQQQRDLTSALSGGGDKATGTVMSTAEKLVLSWKFTNLDGNSNQILDKIEFRELKKLIRRAVKPRRCGRAFGKFCDLDDDGRLSRNEWNNCITKDGINGHFVTTHNTSKTSSSYNNSNNNVLHTSYSNYNNKIHLNNNNNNNGHGINTIRVNGPNGHHDTLDSSEDDESNQNFDDYDDDVDYDPDDDNLSIQNTLSSSTKFPPILILRPKPESPLKEPERESDCLADQDAALEEQRNGGTILYVPECTPDGRYQRVQCYRSTPYCWCVHEDTGKNIPGTSIKHMRPQCDLIYTVSRPMKGCPEPKKTMFLKDLKEFLKSQIIHDTKTSGNHTNWSSEDERIATQSFLLLDKNMNKAWERKEWKTFRELVMNSKTLRKCGKKMPRYCDANGDKKITLTEWLNCLQTQSVEVKTPQNQLQRNGESGTSKPLKLTGSNPLEQYLKD
ncbi:SPARC-related modular calcium-binding protein 2-like [Teleopsis dalmanni]|uniref:SPARC-related modular calcium-binding protein 2-like n=1 Tax=Teleopsis dalmanni TaxID=139649 RepID=UPI0018CEB5D1|nr:SPARC-related modular calcium-binding protein 2-like [Teleopsis dalmanni]